MTVEGDAVLLSAAAGAIPVDGALRGAAEGLACLGASRGDWWVGGAGHEWLRLWGCGLGRNVDVVLTSGSDVLAVRVVADRAVARFAGSNRASGQAEGLDAAVVAVTFALGPGALGLAIVASRLGLGFGLGLRIGLGVRVNPDVRAVVDNTSERISAVSESANIVRLAGWVVATLSACRLRAISASACFNNTFLDAAACVLTGRRWGRRAIVGLASLASRAVAHSASLFRLLTEGILRASGALCLKTVSASTRGDVARRMAQVHVLAGLVGAVRDLAAVFSAVSHRAGEALVTRRVVGTSSALLKDAVSAEAR